MAYIEVADVEAAASAGGGVLQEAILQDELRESGDSRELAEEEDRDVACGGRCKAGDAQVDVLVFNRRLPAWRRTALAVLLLAALVFFAGVLVTTPPQKRPRSIKDLAVGTEGFVGLSSIAKEQDIAPSEDLKQRVKTAREAFLRFFFGRSSAQA